MPARQDERRGHGSSRLRCSCDLAQMLAAGGDLAGCAPRRCCTLGIGLILSTGRLDP